MSSVYQRIYAVVKQIPRGKVATYGQIATLAGLARHARQVGYALSALEQDQLPWHRVVNAKGQISERSGPPTFENLQRIHLEKENVRFDSQNRISLRRYQWKKGILKT